MPTTITKNKLSASTDGRAIKITATTPGSANLLHQATSGIGSYDRVYLYGHNIDTLEHLVTIWFGGTTDPDDKREVRIPARTANYPLVWGDVLRNGLQVKGMCDLADKVMVTTPGIDIITP